MDPKVCNNRQCVRTSLEKLYPGDENKEKRVALINLLKINTNRDLGQVFQGIKRTARIEGLLSLLLAAATWGFYSYMPAFPIIWEICAALSASFFLMGFNSLMTYFNAPAPEVITQF